MNLADRNRVALLVPETIEPDVGNGDVAMSAWPVLYYIQIQARTIFAVGYLDQGSSSALQNCDDFIYIRPDVRTVTSCLHVLGDIRSLVDLILSA